jgi:predicted dehydrogenase
MKPQPRRKFLQTLGSGAVAGTLAGSTLTGLSTAPRAEETKAKQPVKVGQIGVGHAHASKLSVYRRSGDYEVVGIAEPDEQLRERARQQAIYQDLPWMTEEELLNLPGLQAVLVETRVRDLLATAERCIDAGLHVHLDKPAGESLPHYRRILGKAAEKNLLVQMGYMYRYNPAVLLLREFLAQGWLGEVFEVHTVMSKVVPPADRKQLAEYPGGMMFELGCHILDLVIGVLGAPDSVTPFVQQASGLDDGLADNMLAVLEYPRAIASVKSSAMEVNGFQRRHLVVCGTEGTFHIQPLDNPSVRVSLSQPRGDYKQGLQEIALPKYTRYVGDAVDMARIIRGEKETDFPYAHDLAVQQTLLKACGLPEAP